MYRDLRELSPLPGFLPDFSVATKGGRSLHGNEAKRGTSTWGEPEYRLARGGHSISGSQ